MKGFQSSAPEKKMEESKKAPFEGLWRGKVPYVRALTPIKAKE